MTRFIGAFTVCVIYVVLIAGGYVLFFRDAEEQEVPGTVIATSSIGAIPVQELSILVVDRDTSSRSTSNTRRTRSAVRARSAPNHFVC